MCVLRNLLVNILVIVNVWVFCFCRGFTVNVQGFVLIFLFKGKYMEFLRDNQSKFTRFGCWLTLSLLYVRAFLVFCSFRGN